MISPSSASVYLRHRDTAFLSQLLFGLLAGVGVAEMGVEVLVQDLRRLLVEVPPLSPGPMGRKSKKQSGEKGGKRKDQNR